MLRFHLDEHVASAIATALRQHGIDVSTSVEANLLNASDEDHVRHALDAGRVIVTHDHDFLRLSAAGTSHAGIAYCHQDKYSIGELLSLLLLMNSCYTTDEMKGHVEYL